MDISAIFYDGWKDLVRIVLAAPAIYFTIIVFIRLAGKRSTSQMNNFDWVVTVALGSIAGAGSSLTIVGTGATSGEGEDCIVEGESEGQQERDRSESEL